MTMQRRVALLLATLATLALQSTANERIKELISVYTEKKTDLEQYLEQIKSLTEETSNLDYKYVELDGRTDTLNSKIRAHNIQQLIDLEERLEDSLEEIRILKSAVNEMSANAGGEVDGDNSTENAVSFQELREAFPSFEDYESGATPVNPTSEAIWNTEIELEKYIIAEGGEIVREKVRAKVMEQKKRQAELIRQAKKESKTVVVPCVSKAEAMDIAIEALTSYANDGIGRTDYALREVGSTIVYDPLFTSSTYTPPDSTVPSYMWHVLGGLPQLLFRKAPIASPEEVISKDAKLGSYWAFQGNKGKITIRLGQPIYVNAISMDFISPKIDDSSSSSAPRYFNVIGYPPCAENDAACGAWGFQHEGDGLFLGSFEFLTDSDAKSVQTFDIVADDNKDANDDSATNAEYDDYDEEEDFGSCGMEASESSSCGGIDSMQSLATYSEDDDDSKEESSSDKPAIAVAAIKLEVTGNWGNVDLTSVYRFRVHGNPLN